MKGNFGSMLTIDFDVTNLEHLNDKDFLESFLRELIEDLKMKIHQVDGKDAIIIDTWTADGLPFTEGTSAVVLITTSSIQLHTAVDLHDKTKGVVYLDVFSCSDLRREQAQKTIDKFFDKPNIRRWLLLER